MYKQIILNVGEWVFGVERVLDTMKMRHGVSTIVDSNPDLL